MSDIYIYICCGGKDCVPWMKQLGLKKSFCNLICWLNRLGGRLDVGNATKESIAPVLAPNHISLSKTSLSCVDAETNTSLLLNAEVCGNLE